MGEVVFLDGTGGPWCLLMGGGVCFVSSSGGVEFSFMGVSGMFLYGWEYGNGLMGVLCYFIGGNVGVFTYG